MTNQKIQIQSSPLKLNDLNDSLVVVSVTTTEVASSSRNRSNPKNKEFGFDALDRALQGRLRRFLVENSFAAKSGASLVFPWHTGNTCRGVLVIGAPKDSSDEFDSVGLYRTLGSQIIKTARSLRATEVTVLTRHLDLNKDHNLVALVEGAILSRYSFTRYRAASAPSFVNKQSPAVKRIKISGTKRISQERVEEAHITAWANLMARDLVNTPPNDCSPRFILAAAKKVAQRGKLAITVFDRKRLEKMKANLLLAVSKGSDEPPYLVKLVYRPRARRARSIVSLVGKGVTFDSGGLSIKSAGGMETMKMDMSGAAAVLATMQAIAELKPAVEVRAYLALTENMINGHATRPGDIVTGIAEKSVEILNTDAEGRLILADALALAVRDGCDEIVDLATLTGACVVALGDDYAGLFTADSRLQKRLSDAAALAGERLWPMPLAPEYEALIKSKIADIKNTGGRSGGAITAALFLKEFVGKTPWAHLDIAGPAWSDSEKGYLSAGGVGFGVRTLVRYVMER